MTYIFDHIYKTGGTTFMGSYLAGAVWLGALKKEEVFLVRGLRDANREDLERLRLLPDEERKRLRFIAGHNTGLLRPCYPNAQFLALVRDPIERVVSAYLHAKFHPDAWGVIGREIQEKAVDLVQFVQEDLFAHRDAASASVHNWQSKVLLDSVAEGPMGDDEAIKSLIRARFHLVGYTEALELFIFVLHVTEGFPLVLFSNRLVRKEREGFSCRPETLAVIEAYNSLDRAVYRCVCQEFESRAAQIWTERISKKYDEYTQALEGFRRDSEEDVNAFALFA